MLRTGLRRFYRGVRHCALSGKRAFFYRREDKDNAETVRAPRFAERRVSGGDLIFLSRAVGIIPHAPTADCCPCVPHILWLWTFHREIRRSTAGC